MTLPEFMELQKSKGWKRFCYLSENQPDYYCGDAVKANLEFGEMFVSCNPQDYRLFFTNGLAWLQIDRVKSVDCKPCALGEIITAECGDGKRYVVVAQN